MKKITFIILYLFASIVFADQEVKQIVNTVCAACHMQDGNSSITANPKLAGQFDSYLIKQLNNYKSGLRKNAVMSGIAANLSDNEILELSKYFSKQEYKLSKAKENGKGSLGEKIYRAGIVSKKVPACAGCHGPAGHGVPSMYPRLNGQHAEYLINQLVQFSKHERANDEASMMRMISEKLSENEMKAVSDYIQGLR
jgi:cytochrome c553